MKKLLLSSAVFMLLAGNIFAQIVGAISLTTSVTVSSSCNPPCDGTASVMATGGTPPYTYNWSSTPTQTTATATGLCPGTYTVLVNDGNPGLPNYSTATVTITCNSTGNTLVAVASATAATACVAPCNGTATVTATGGLAPYTYGWSSIPAQTTQNATGLCPGTYTVVVRDATTPVPNQTFATVTVTCSGITTGTMTVTTSVTAATNCTAPCNGTATATPAGGTPPYFYAWGTTPVQTTQTATGLCPGSYSVTVTDSNTPSANTSKGNAVVTCNTANSVNGISLDESISLYPNPAQNALTILFNTSVEGMVKISISGILGTQVMGDEFYVKNASNRLIDISTLPNGVYNVTFFTENNILTKQFIKQ